MDFIYFYKTSDGVRHEGRISASNRDEAFSTLRNSGIRPIKVIACDGSKENGAPARRGIKNKVAIISLSAALLVTLAYIIVDMHSAEHVALPQTAADKMRGIESNIVKVKKIAKPRPRKQLSQQVENPSSFFLHEAESFLSRYAQPGRELDSQEFSEAMKDDLLDALEDVIIIHPSDPREVTELKHIVAGLKEEASMILAGGKSVDDLIAWFDERQKMEIAYRKRIIEDSSSREEKERMLSALSLPSL